MLKNVVNTTQESHTQLSGPCLQYVDFEKRPIFESKMLIANTILADRAMKKDSEVRHFCNSILANINDILKLNDPKSRQNYIT